MSETSRNLQDVTLFDLAEMALREAVAEVIEDRRRTGDPVVTWRDGEVVLVPAEELPPSPNGEAGINGAGAASGRAGEGTDLP